MVEGASTLPSPPIFTNPQVTYCRMFIQDISLTLLLVRFLLQDLHSLNCLGSSIFERSQNVTETVAIAGKNIGITFSVQGLHVSSTFYIMYVVV
jgi:hypothetical protein